METEVPGSMLGGYLHSFLFLQCGREKCRVNGIDRLRNGKLHRRRSNLNFQIRRTERALERHSQVKNSLTYNFEQTTMLCSVFGTEDEEHAYSFDSLTCASLNT